MLKHHFLYFRLYKVIDSDDVFNVCMIFIMLGQQRVDCFQLLFFLKILDKFGEFDTMLNEVTELLISNGDLGIVIGIKQEFNEREVG